MGTDIVSSHICLQRQLVIRIASFFFNHAVDVTNVGGIVLICICIGSVSCSKAALNISNLTAIDTDTAIVLQVNLCTSSSLGITFASCCLVGNGCNACKVLGQLDFQLAIHIVHADVVGGQFRTICTADDIDSVIQLLGDSFSCIVLAIVAGKLQAIFHGSHLMFPVLVFIDNPVDAIFAIHTVGTFNTIFAIFAIFALLDGDIHSPILAVRAGRAYEADSTRRTIFTIFARRTNDHLCHTTIKGFIDRIAGDQVAIIFSDGSIITDFNLTICIDAQMFAGIDGQLMVLGEFQSITFVDGNGLIRLIHEDAVALSIGVIGNILSVLLHLIIQFQQVIASSLGHLHIFPIFGRPYFIVHRAAGDQLLGILRHCTGTQSLAPGVFVGGHITVFEILADIGSVDAGQFLDLGHVNSIRIIGAGGHPGDLAGHAAIGFAYGNSSFRRSPGLLGLVFYLFSRIIALLALLHRGHRITAQGHTVVHVHVGVMADDYGARSGQFLAGIGRADDDIVLSIYQGVVITDDDIRLVLVDAVTSYTVVGTNDVVIFAVSQGILEAIDIVVLRRGAFCIGAVCARDGVADTDNLAHIGAFDVIAAAHDHDLSTTLRNSSL